MLTDYFKFFRLSKGKFSVKSRLDFLNRCFAPPVKKWGDVEVGITKDNQVVKYTACAFAENIREHGIQLKIASR